MIQILPLQNRFAKDKKIRKKSHLGQTFYYEAFQLRPKIGNFLHFPPFLMVRSITWSICISVNAFWFQQNANAD